MWPYTFNAFVAKHLCFYVKALIHISSMKIVDPKTGDEKPITISVDDGIRPNTSVSELAKLKPVFKKDGTTTAGRQLFSICSFSSICVIVSLFQIV